LCINNGRWTRVFLAFTFTTNAAAVQTTQESLQTIPRHSTHRILPPQS
jgi:hypothetical protein